MGKKVTLLANETRLIGKKLGETLKPGDIVGLYGDLGSGKTTFVQGVALGLGIKQRIVSPTFIIVRSYEFKNEKKIEKFYHIDLYRVESVHDIESIGLRELLEDKNATILIEWPERLGELLPKNIKKIFFRYLSDKKREIVYE